MGACLGSWDLLAAREAAVFEPALGLGSSAAAAVQQAQRERYCSASAVQVLGSHVPGEFVAAELEGHNKHIQRAGEIPRSFLPSSAARRRGRLT